jgi:NADH-quinone oxidoreductase subunit L
MPLLSDTPGYWFVLAMLLPLVTFLVILVGSAVWAVARRYDLERLQNLLGSPSTGLLTGLFASGILGLAFVCSVVGLVEYHTEFTASREAIAEARATFEAWKPDRDKWEAEIERLTDARTRAEEDNKPAEVGRLSEELKEPRLKLEEILAMESRAAQLEALWEATRATRWKGTLYTLFAIHPTDRDNPQRGTQVSLGFAIDTLSALLFVMVTLVALLIHLYSLAYMEHELPPEGVEDHELLAAGVSLTRRGRFSRFYLYLALFCFAMLNLVLADNLLQVFVSWELVGLCSYLLIGFYYERQSASDAATKAFLTNGIGDVGLVLGMALLWSYCGTLQFDALFAQVRHPMADAHGMPGKLAGQIVRADEVPSPKGKKLVVNGPGEGGAFAVLFPERPLGETLDAAQTAELNRYRKALARTTDPAERARLERLISVKDPALDHFHNLRPNREIRPRVDRAAEEFGVMPYWMLVLAGLGIFLGCVGKSAQFPLHGWLPDAMAGPTPISALIHAATMVAAGVYLVGRCYPLFTPEVLLVIAYTGAITVLLGASIALVSNDIKQVLAYSTVSQLGLMMLAMGVGGWVAALFHLLTHAVFKALLFLAAGAVIHGCHHEQNLQKMGGLARKMPFTALTMLIGVLAIAGVPLFSGWYSKDAILSQALGYAYVHREHAFLFLIPILTVSLTAFYMFRLWFLAFAGTPRDRQVYQQAKESPWIMTAPLGLLAILALGMAWGYAPWDAADSLLKDTLAPAQPLAVAATFGNGAQEVLPTVAAKPAAASETLWSEKLHEYAGLLGFVGMVLGLALAAAAYSWRLLDPSTGPTSFPGVHRFLVQRWYFDVLVDALVVRPALRLGQLLSWHDRAVLDGSAESLARGGVQLSRWVRGIDVHMIDGLINGFGATLFALGRWLRSIQTGYLRTYVLYLVFTLGVLFLLLFYFVSQGTVR